MMRIGFVGVPGAGKTSTSRGLAAFCRGYEKLRRIELVAEYARRFLAKYGPVEQVSDQYKIMQKQIEWEDVIPQKETDIIITDSPVFLGFLYALEVRDVNKVKDAMYVNDIFKRMNKLNSPQRYDVIFHLPPLLKPVEDGVREARHFEDSWREEADLRIQFIFRLFPPKHFITVQDETLEGRVQECIQHLIRIID